MAGEGISHTKQSMRGMRRVLSFHLIRPEDWDQYKYLRGGLAWGMILCTLGAAGNWYNWAHGRVVLEFPVSLTLGALVILAIVPKRWELITWCVGGVFVLSIVATLLRRMSLVLGLEVMGVTGGGYLIMLYIKQRLDRFGDRDEQR